MLYCSLVIHGLCSYPIVGSFKRRILNFLHSFLIFSSNVILSPNRSRSQELIFINLFESLQKKEIVLFLSIHVIHAKPPKAELNQTRTYWCKENFKIFFSTQRCLGKYTLDLFLGVQDDGSGFFSRKMIFDVTIAQNQILIWPKTSQKDKSPRDTEISQNKKRSSGAYWVARPRAPQNFTPQSPMEFACPWKF